MEIFSQNKLLIRCVIFLALLNVFSISIFWWKESHQGPLLFPRNEDYHDVSGVLQRELNLTPEQTEQIKKLRSDFFEKETTLTATIRSERDSMNQLMFNKDTDAELVKAIARRVADNEYQMELYRFEQAQRLKSICTPEQLQKFNGLVKEIRDYFRPDNQPKKR
jgi:Spy/CpxP family protein refolding chaperone